jgi:hypothetical protein
MTEIIELQNLADEFENETGRTVPSKSTASIVC